jgi:hypothetical protein
MKADAQHNNECPELGIELKTTQADLQPSAGPDTLPVEHINFLSERKLYTDTWQHRNALSGLDVYETCKACHEIEIMYSGTSVLEFNSFLEAVRHPKCS